MDKVTITIQHEPEGDGSLDNDRWTKIFGGANLAEALAQTMPWALLYEAKRRKKQPQPKHEADRTLSAIKYFAEHTDHPVV